MIKDTQFFREIRDTLSEEDDLISDMVYENEELFEDMLFSPKSITGDYIKCQEMIGEEWEDAVVDIPDDFRLFSYEYFIFKFDDLPKGVGGEYNLKTQTITLARGPIVESVLLHEMIHMYEQVVNEQPLFYHDTLVYVLYQNLKEQIKDLDDRIKSHAHILNEQSIYNNGGLHDILFLLKSFDLDLKKGYKLGTVFGYGMAD